MEQFSHMSYVHMIDQLFCERGYTYGCSSGNVGSCGRNSQEMAKTKREGKLF